MMIAETDASMMQPNRGNASGHESTSAACGLQPETTTDAIILALQQAAVCANGMTNSDMAAAGQLAVSI